MKCHVRLYTARVTRSEAGCCGREYTIFSKMQGDVYKLCVTTVKVLLALRCAARYTGIHKGLTLLHAP